MNTVDQHNRIFSIAFSLSQYNKLKSLFNANRHIVQSAAISRARKKDTPYAPYLHIIAIEVTQKLEEKNNIPTL